MTLPDVIRIFNHWKRNPPLRWLVAACASALGVKLPEPETTDQKKYMTKESFAALVKATGGRVPGMGQM